MIFCSWPKFALFSLSLALSDAYCSANFLAANVSAYIRSFGEIFCNSDFFFACVYLTLRETRRTRLLVHTRYYMFFFLFYFYDRISSIHTRAQGCSQRNGSEMWLRSNPGARSLRIRQWFNAPQGPRTRRHRPARCCYGLCDLKTWQTSATTTSGGIQQALVLTETSCIFDPLVIAPPRTLFYTQTHPPTNPHTHYNA